MQVFVEMKDFLPSWAAGEDKEDVKDDEGESDLSKLANVLEKRFAEAGNHGRHDAGKESKKYLDILR